MREYAFTGETKAIRHPSTKKVIVYHQVKRLLSDEFTGESENNLSHKDKCFVYDYAIVFGEILVFSNVMVFNNVIDANNLDIPKDERIYDHFKISSPILIFDDVKICGNLAQVQTKGKTMNVIVSNKELPILVNSSLLVDEMTGLKGLIVQKHISGCPIPCPDPFADSWEVKPWVDWANSLPKGKYDNIYPTLDGIIEFHSYEETRVGFRGIKHSDARYEDMDVSNLSDYSEYGGGVISRMLIHIPSTDSTYKADSDHGIWLLDGWLVLTEGD